MDKQINLMDLLKLCVRRWWALVIGIVVGGLLFGIYTEFFITPIYTSVCTLYSENTKDVLDAEATSVNLTNIVTRQTLVKTYAEVLSSNIFLKKVAEDTKLGYNHSQLLGMLSMTSKNGTEILVVRVSSPNPKHAYLIAKSIMKLASEQVGEVVDGGSMNPLDEPEIPARPSSPNKSKNIQLGAVAGLVLSMIIIFILEIIDNKIKNTEQVTDTFDFPVLGEIPFYSTGNKVVDTTRAEVYYSSET